MNETMYFFIASEFQLCSEWKSSSWSCFLFRNYHFPSHIFQLYEVQRVVQRQCTKISFEVHDKNENINLIPLFHARELFLVWRGISCFLNIKRHAFLPKMIIVIYCSLCKFLNAHEHNVFWLHVVIDKYDECRLTTWLVFSVRVEVKAECSTWYSKYFWQSTKNIFQMLESYWFWNMNYVYTKMSWTLQNILNLRSKNSFHNSRQSLRKRLKKILINSKSSSNC